MYKLDLNVMQNWRKSKCDVKSNEHHSGTIVLIIGMKDYKQKRKIQ